MSIFSLFHSFLPTKNIYFIRFSSSSKAKKLLKNYKFPEILPNDCEEQHIRGWGPGGSCVNSASNAVLLKHKPTGCTVKVHQSRVLRENIKIAYERLKIEVDKHLNAENSYSVQFEKIKSEIEQKTKKSSQRRRQLIAEFKARGELVVELNQPKENCNRRSCLLQHNKWLIKNSFFK